MNKERNIRPFSDEILINTRIRQATIDSIVNDEFSNDHQQFYDSIRNTKHPLMLTFYSLEELDKINTFTLQGLSIGFALKETNRGCEIVGVHNNERQIEDIGIHLVEAAIRNGGDCLNHFGSEKLIKMYQTVGLIEIDREAFNSLYDPEGFFENKYGQLPIIFRQLFRK